MPAQGDDALRPEAVGGQDPAQSDRTVTDDGHGVAALDPRAHRGVVSRSTAAVETAD